MRHEIELRLDARGEFRAGDDFRHVPMTQGAVGIEIAVPMRMMRAFDRFASGARAAGDAGDEQAGVGEPQRQQRHDGEQRGRREASGVRHVRRRRFLQMLGHGAGEFTDSRRRAMRVLVDGFISRGARIAEVGRDIDAVHASAGRVGGREQAIDDGGGHAVRRGREQGAARCAAYEGLDLVEPGEFQVRIGAAQMRECARDGHTGLAVRQNGGHVELRMPRDQTQQLAGHIAGAAQHDGGSGNAHSAATLDSRTWLNPNREMM